MDYRCYVANGLCRSADAGDPRYGWSEFRLWNPAERTTAVRMTVFFAARPPTPLPPLELGPYANPYLSIPRQWPEVFTGCGEWGMELASDHPILADHILVAGLQGRQQQERFAGGVADVLAKAPARRWYFGDGLVLRFDPAKAPLPFNEFEWWHILNPGPRDAQVAIECFYGNAGRDTLRYTVPAQRVLMIDNWQLVRPNNAFGMRVESSQPVVVEAERMICGLHSREEWGAHIHTPRPGLPGPLAGVDAPNHSVNESPT